MLLWGKMLFFVTDVTCTCTLSIALFRLHILVSKINFIEVKVIFPKIDIESCYIKNKKNKIFNKNLKKLPTIDGN